MDKTDKNSMDDSDDPGYWCVVCGRLLLPIEETKGGNVYVHDDIPHPELMTYDEDSVMH